MRELAATAANTELCGQRVAAIGDGQIRCHRDGDDHAVGIRRVAGFGRTCGERAAIRDGVDIAHLRHRSRPGNAAAQRHVTWLVHDHRDRDAIRVQLNINGADGVGGLRSAATPGLTVIRLTERRAQSPVPLVTIH